MTDVTIFQFILMILATARLTRLVVKDSIMQEVRDIFLIESGPNEYIPKNKFGEMLHCTWCVGFWLSILMFLFVTYTDPVYHMGVCLVLSISFVSTILVNHFE